MIDVYEHKTTVDKSFDEQQWMKILFLISDTQQWLDNIQRGIIYQVPFCCKKKLFQKSYYHTAVSLAHILENHYYKIPRHPEKSKFTIEVAEILSYLREASDQTPTPICGSQNFKRSVETKEYIGTDKNGIPSLSITIITDHTGKIMTAFPGEFEK